MSCASKTDNDSRNEHQGSPRIGEAAMGGGHRPAPSPELQKLIDETVPYFKQYVYVNEKGDSLQYNLYSPKDIVEGEKYPLLLFPLQ